MESVFNVNKKINIKSNLGLNYRNTMKIPYEHESVFYSSLKEYYEQPKF